MDTHSLSATLADYILQVDYAKLPARVVELARLSFLDWLGSALAGSREIPGKMFLELENELGGNPQATLISEDKKTSVISAALVNGGLSHIVELDDVHKAAILHPAAPIMPAALAVAEWKDADGKKLIEAIVAGYDVALRIGEAVTPSHYRYWHTTGTCGTFGAAAAAGKVLGLNRPQLIYALGNAGTQAAGLWEFLADGAMSKHLHPGKAAMNGVLAALLAAREFTGASKILEGEKGFFKATAQTVKEELITEQLGEKFKIEENCFKIYASCRHTHPAVDVALKLVGEHGILAKEIQQVIVETYSIALEVTGRYHPISSYAAKFSLPYCMALALTVGELGLPQFSEEYLKREDLHQLMSKIELSVDPVFDARYPEAWPARVRIVTGRGVFSASTDYPRGDPENPVTAAELQTKFLSLAAPVIGSVAAEEMARRVLETDKLNPVGQLFADI